MKTIKLFLTTIAMLLCSVMANAYDFEVDGIYYNIISSTDLTVEVTSGDNKYTGEMIIPTMVNYNSKDLTVTSIGASAFYGCDGLTYISIPDSVRRIGAGAFDNCTSLKEVRIENGYTNLELEHSNHTSFSSSNDNVRYYNRYGLFHDCPLERLYVGRDLRYKLGKIYGGNSGFYYYDHSPFYNNTELKVVTIGDCVSTIGESLFAKCSTLENIIISNNVTSIGNGAFFNCSSIRNITIPKNVTLIGNRTFSNCTSLKELHIEDGGTEIEMGYGEIYKDEDRYYGLFHDCPLESLYIGRNLTYKVIEQGGTNHYFDSPFGKIKTLKSVTIGDSVTAIGVELFNECRNLTYAKIGNNVTRIGNYTFSRCDSLTNISIPRSVTTIGRDAFSYCYSISSITIPNSVERIGFQAFSNCTSLKYVKIEDSTNFLSTGNIDNTSLPTSIFRGCSLGKVYLGRNLSNSPEGCVFYDVDSLIIGNNITRIGENTFARGANISIIYSMCTNPPVIDNGNDFTELQYVNTTIFVPKGTLTAYQTADVWKDFWDIQEYVLDKKFCVNYYIDGELYAVDSVKHCDRIILREEPIKEGYTFSGWSEAPETMPAHDVEIYGDFFLSSAVDNIDVPTKKSQKVIENNQLFILLPNGKKYTVMGQEL